MVPQAQTIPFFSTLTIVTPAGFADVQPSSTSQSRLTAACAGEDRARRGDTGTQQSGREAGKQSGREGKKSRRGEAGGLLENAGGEKSDVMKRRASVCELPEL